MEGQGKNHLEGNILTEFEGGEGASCAVEAKSPKARDKFKEWYGTVVEA